MTALLLVLLGLILAALTGFAKTIATGEIRGMLSDRCHRSVDRAARLLSPDLADDLVAEWHAELAALEDADRLVSAWRYARSLPRAAARIGHAGTPRRARIRASAPARAWARVRRAGPTLGVFGLAVFEGLLTGVVAGLISMALAVAVVVGIALPTGRDPGALTWLYWVVFGVCVAAFFVWEMFLREPYLRLRPSVGLWRHTPPNPARDLARRVGHR